MEHNHSLTSFNPFQFQEIWHSGDRAILTTEKGLVRKRNARSNATFSLNGIQVKRTRVAPRFGIFWCKHGLWQFCERSGYSGSKYGDVRGNRNKVMEHQKFCQLSLFLDQLYSWSRNKLSWQVATHVLPND